MKLCKICGLASKKTICNACKANIFKPCIATCVECSNTFNKRFYNQLICEACKSKKILLKPKRFVKKCVCCDSRFKTDNIQRKYCTDCFSPAYRRKFSKFKEFHKKFGFSYPEKLILANIVLFLQDKPLTVPIPVFKSHPLTNYILFPEHNKYVCQKLARKIQIPAGQLCEICNVNPARHRHHPDYRQPLYIRFLCASCHSKLHHPKKSIQTS